MLVKEKRAFNTQQIVVPAIVSGKEITTPSKKFILFFVMENKKVYINGKGLNILKSLLEKNGYALPFENFKEKDNIIVEDSALSFLKMFLNSKEIEVQFAVRKNMVITKVIDQIKLNPTKEIEPSIILQGNFLKELNEWAAYFGHKLHEDHIEFTIHKTKFIVMADPCCGPFNVEKEFTLYKKLFYNFFEKNGKQFLKCANKLTGLSIDLKQELQVYYYMQNRFNVIAEIS